MSWFLLAFSTAFFESIRDVFNKKALKDINEYVVAWSLMFFSFLFLSPVLLFIEIPTLESKFWIALLSGGFLNTIAHLALIKALKISDLSKVAPITTFTPLFILITSPFMIGEFPNSVGLMGIGLIVVGCYVLNLKERQKGYLAPLRSLFAETGSRLALLVAFLWSISSNFDKIGVQNSSPLFWVISLFLCMSLMMLPLVLASPRINQQQIIRGLKDLVLIGIFNAITVAIQMTAITLTLVAYVIAVKRTSALFSVGFGYFIFQEKEVKERLAGAAIMVLGVVLITLSNFF
ncbi:MAG: DMT family transporter [Coleofasciculus sp. S288]|nr:DMT family transporter [Coleofasciculus sp. S288]